MTAIINILEVLIPKGGCNFFRQFFLSSQFKVHCKSIRDNSTNIKWHAPDPGIVKLNFDGSVNLHKAAAGFVIRNHCGQILGAGSFNMDGATISEVEAKALAFALGNDCSKLLVKGRCLGICLLRWKKLEDLLRSLITLVTRNRFL